MCLYWLVCCSSGSAVCCSLMPDPWVRTEIIVKLKIILSQDCAAFLHSPSPSDCLENNRRVWTAWQINTVNRNSEQQILVPVLLQVLLSSPLATTFQAPLSTTTRQLARSPSSLPRLVRMASSRSGLLRLPSVCTSTKGTATLQGATMFIWHCYLAMLASWLQAPIATYYFFGPRYVEMLLLCLLGVTLMASIPARAVTWHEFQPEQ